VKKHEIMYLKLKVPKQKIKRKILLECVIVDSLVIVKVPIRVILMELIPLEISMKKIGTLKRANITYKKLTYSFVKQDQEKVHEFIKETKPLLENNSKEKNALVPKILLGLSSIKRSKSGCLFFIHLGREFGLPVFFQLTSWYYHSLYSQA
ncbi:18188_t:CDS:2, partial [Gigaspora rosea]